MTHIDVYSSPMLTSTGTAKRSNGWSWQMLPGDGSSGEWFFEARLQFQIRRTCWLISFHCQLIRVWEKALLSWEFLRLSNPPIPPSKFRVSTLVIIFSSSSSSSFITSHFLSDIGGSFLQVKLDVRVKGLVLKWSRLMVALALLPPPTFPGIISSTCFYSLSVFIIVS